jgi:hypothetical protein
MNSVTIAYKCILPEKKQNLRQRRINGDTYFVELQEMKNIKIRTDGNGNFTDNQNQIKKEFAFKKYF